jgi:head-tail adaptor
MRRSGPKNLKFDLQRLSTSPTTDAAGEIDHTVDGNWTTFAKRSGSMVTPKGTEFWNADQVDANGVREIGFVYDSMTRLLTTAMRLKLGTRKFNIESAENKDGKNREVVVHCVEPK